MVDPVAMCALAQKLLQRQEAQAVSLSQAPLLATELQIPLQENSLESKSPDFKLPIPLPGVPSRCVCLGAVASERLPNAFAQPSVCASV